MSITFYYFVLKCPAIKEDISNYLIQHKKILDKTEVADNVELVIEKHLQLSVVGQSCDK